MSIQQTESGERFGVVMGWDEGITVLEGDNLLGLLLHAGECLTGGFDWFKAGTVGPDFMKEAQGILAGTGGNLMLNHGEDLEGVAIESEEADGEGTAGSMHMGDAFNEIERMIRSIPDAQRAGSITTSTVNV